MAALPASTIPVYNAIINDHNYMKFGDGVHTKKYLPRINVKWEDITDFPENESSIVTRKDLHSYTGSSDALLPQLEAIINSNIKQSSILANILTRLKIAEEDIDEIEKPISYTAAIVDFQRQLNKIADSVIRNTGTLFSYNKAVDLLNHDILTTFRTNSVSKKSFDHLAEGVIRNATMISEMKEILDKEEKPEREIPDHRSGLTALQHQLDKLSSVAFTHTFQIKRIRDDQTFSNFAWKTLSAIDKFGTEIESLSEASMNSSVAISRMKDAIREIEAREVEKENGREIDLGIFKLIQKQLDSLSEATIANSKDIASGKKTIDEILSDDRINETLVILQANLEKAIHAIMRNSSAISEDRDILKELLDRKPEINAHDYRESILSLQRQIDVLSSVVVSHDIDKYKKQIENAILSESEKNGIRLTKAEENIASLVGAIFNHSRSIFDNRNLIEGLLSREEGSEQKNYDQVIASLQKQLNTVADVSLRGILGVKEIKDLLEKTKQYDDSEIRHQLDSIVNAIIGNSRAISDNAKILEDLSNIDYNIGSTILDDGKLENLQAQINTIADSSIRIASTVNSLIDRLDQHITEAELEERVEVQAFIRQAESVANLQKQVDSLAEASLEWIIDNRTTRDLVESILRDAGKDNTEIEFLKTQIDSLLNSIIRNSRSISDNAGDIVDIWEYLFNHVPVDFTPEINDLQRQINIVYETLPKGTGKDYTTYLGYLQDQVDSTADVALRAMIRSTLVRDNLTALINTKAERSQIQLEALRQQIDHAVNAIIGNSMDISNFSDKLNDFYELFTDANINYLQQKVQELLAKAENADQYFDSHEVQEYITQRIVESLVDKVASLENASIYQSSAISDTRDLVLSLIEDKPVDQPEDQTTLRNLQRQLDILSENSLKNAYGIISLKSNEIARLTEKTNDLSSILEIKNQLDSISDAIIRSAGDMVRAKDALLELEGVTDSEAEIDYRSKILSLQDQVNKISEVAITTSFAVMELREKLNNIEDVLANG